MDELKQTIEGRVRALAHGLLARSRWAGADLRLLAAEELSPYCQDGESRARIEGPNLMLDQVAAQAMAVALHELTTNAVKYGALSIPTGRVVEWSCRPLRRLLFRWAEIAGPRVRRPRRQGFGTRMIERMLEGQLNGELKFDWREEGIVCEIAIDT